MPDKEGYVIKVDIQPIQPGELSQVIDVLGKAFANRPSSSVILSDRPGIEKGIRAVFGAMLKYMSGQIFVAKHNGQIVGVMRIVEWPGCQLKPLQGLRMVPGMLKAGGLGTMLRGMKTRMTWAKKDPKQPHWHLDPLGVTPDLRGQGIGSQMMEYYCNHIDKLGMAAYHETDRPENVKFYERFGYKVIGEEIIMGFPNWYMWRSPGGETA